MKIDEEQVRNHCKLAATAFDWCVKNGLELERGGNAEQAAQWALLAAWTASRFGHSYLCSAPLKTFLGRLGRQLIPAGNSAGSGTRGSLAR